MKFRSPIAHEARTPPPRQPALDRHSPHSTSYRSSRPTRPRTALRKRSPAQHAPRPKLPAPALHKQPAHCAPISAFAQHTLPRHRTSPPLRTSPSPGPCPPSPERGSAPPPPYRSPALPINLCATCPAVSICPHAAGAIAVRRPRWYVSGQLRPMGRRPHVHAQRTPAQAFVCRDARMHAHISHVLSAELQQSIAGLFCRQYELSCIAGTHVLQAHMHCSTPWADAMLLWICTQSCKSGAGMDTTLKWMLARASDQGEYTPPAPCL